MTAISSWGRLQLTEHELVPLTMRSNVRNLVLASKPGLAYGMGRSYGDVCLNPGGTLWQTTGLDRFISFDNKTGKLVCEAGMLLRDIHRLTVPQGWMLPVTPGTQLITVGGAIANDVHGKNHHIFGTFGNHVHRITLLRTNGEVIECGPQLQQEWFAATVGGLGLTGLMLSAELHLRPIASPWLNTEIIPYTHLEEFFVLADNSETAWEHTVSWIDCSSSTMHRGIFMRANHANILNRKEPSKRTLSFSIRPPDLLINKLTISLFNRIYFNTKERQINPRIQHYESFFYPLDNLSRWNLNYGSKGFYQYQTVIPQNDRTDVIKALLKEISRSSESPFLAVLKTFGKKKAAGMLSFPHQGVTIALDFCNHGSDTLKLFERFDSIVHGAGGRIYPAKDARMPRSLFESGYPRLSEFLPYRDPGITSAMSRRLMGQ